jgi:hypothetical protein
MTTTELLNQLLEKAKTDKRTLLAIKNAAVRGQQFELAANIRELEKSCFPETEEEKEAKEMAEKLNLLFRMVELTVSKDLCWLIGAVMEEHRKKKGKFSIEDAVRLKSKKRDLFIDSE